MAESPRWPTVAALGSAQTLAWASSYYLPALLAVPMARELQVSTPTVFGAFSVALIVSAAVGPLSGRTIDRFGGRPVLMASSVVFALGLVALSMARGPLSLFAAWGLIGVAMGSGLYEAAFSSLVRLYGTRSRGAITGITLFGGFASTVGWPLSAWLESRYGWRGACIAWAALHLLAGLPLNAWLPRADTAPRLPPQVPVQGPGAAVPAAPARSAPLLAFVFGVSWFISTAMAAHLPRLLQLGGATLATAVAMGALVGPAQVAGRLLEFGFLQRFSPLLSARLAAMAHPLGAAAFALFGAPLAAGLALLHGAGNGILTIANGTLPLLLFGPQGYGRRQGLLMLPARFAQAAAPFAFGVCIDRWGAGALWVSAALGLAALAALGMLRAPARPASKAATPQA